MYKIHRQNHNFQIAYFLAGACHTPDGAYAQLQGLREARDAALKHYAVSQLKNKAKALRANLLLAGDAAEHWEGQAELLELAHAEEAGRVLYDAAVSEMAFIDECIALVQPHRQYKHLPDADAYEMAQREEWKLELIKRARNAIVTTGTIPTDHYDTMSMHPDFRSDILPEIERIFQLAKENTPSEMAILLEPKFQFPQLLPAIKHISISGV